MLSRPGCHLCEQVVAEVEPLCHAAGATLRVLDVDSRADWREAYGLRIPVLLGAGRELAAWPVDLDRVARWLDGNG